jgi:DNA repair ATPase RecN
MSTSSMRHQPLTKSEFHRTMTRLMGLVTTKDDLKPVVESLRETRKQLSTLTTSVDRFGKRFTVDHDELVVLRARYDRLADVLIHKGVATRQDLAV